MKELELLKKDWKKDEGQFKDYSENEIYVIIKHKSVSVVKTLFIVGLIEILLWSVYGYINGEFPYLRIYYHCSYFFSKYKSRPEFPVVD
jgi:hypothetical protein